MILETYTRVFVDAEDFLRTIAFYIDLLSGQQTMRFAYPETGLELAAISSPSLSILIIAGPLRCSQRDQMAALEGIAANLRTVPAVAPPRPRKGQLPAGSFTRTPAWRPQHQQQRSVCSTSPVQSEQSCCKRPQPSPRSTGRRVRHPEDGACRHSDMRPRHVAHVIRFTKNKSSGRYRLFPPVG